VAEGGYSRIVIGTAPLAEKIGKAVDQYFGPGFLSVCKEELLPCQLAFSVVRFSIPPYKGGLDGGGQHNRAGVAAGLQRIQQGGRETKVAGHKFGLVFGAVDTGQVEDEVGLLATLLQ